MSPSAHTPPVAQEATAIVVVVVAAVVVLVGATVVVVAEVTTVKIFVLVIAFCFFVARIFTCTKHVPVFLVTIMPPTREHPARDTFQVTTPLEFVLHTDDGEIFEDGDSVDTFQLNEGVFNADTT